MASGSKALTYGVLLANFQVRSPPDKRYLSSILHASSLRRVLIGESAAPAANSFTP